MTNRMKSGPVRIGELIGAILEKADKDKHRPESIEAVASWQQIAGPRLARFSRAVSLRDGKLFVEVRSPAWKQELLLQKRKIVKKINSSFGKNIVSDMVINVRDFIYVDGK